MGLPIAYRQKIRSDEVVLEFEPGMPLWVPSEDGTREHHICLDENGNSLPVEEYRKHKENIARRKREANRFGRRRHGTRPGRYLFA